MHQYTAKYVYKEYIRNTYSSYTYCVHTFYTHSDTYVHTGMYAYVEKQQSLASLPYRLMDCYKREGRTQVIKSKAKPTSV